MAIVTVELRNLLKTDFELFDFDYEFDDKEMANQIEESVIDFYYDYEIGRETPEAFKRSFKLKWRQAMSFYNKIHNTSLLEYNPLINYKMSEALEQLATSSKVQDSTTDNTNKSKTTDSRNDDMQSTGKEDSIQTGDNTNTRTDNLKSTTNSSDTTSDYPQQSIADGDYLSGQRLSDSDSTNTGTVKDQGNSSATNNSVSEVNSSSTSSGISNTEGNTKAIDHTTSKGTDNTTYEKKIEGLTGRTYQELIRLERENIMRITGMIIEELKPCFILVH